MYNVNVQHLEKLSNYEESLRQQAAAKTQKRSLISVQETVEHHRRSMEETLNVVKQKGNHLF